MWRRGGVGGKRYEKGDERFAGNVGGMLVGEERDGFAGGGWRYLVGWAKRWGRVRKDGLYRPVDGPSAVLLNNFLWRGWHI